MVEVAAEARQRAGGRRAWYCGQDFLHGATLEEAIPGTEGGLKEAAAEVDSQGGYAG